jgi:hypothetical protein
MELSNQTLTAIIVTGVVALIGKILFDWLKGNRNGRKGPDVCVFHKDIVAGFEKMDGIKNEQTKAASILKQILDAIKENNRNIIDLFKRE